MKELPLIVGFGGMNSAGRSSGFHSYKRMVADQIPKHDMQSTWQDLATRMKIMPETGLTADTVAKIKQHTLMRKITSFNPDHLLRNKKASRVNTFSMAKVDLPKVIPNNWQICEENNSQVTVTITGEGIDIFVPTTGKLGISFGANIPEGFDPGDLYPTRSHPLGIRMAVYGASDTLNSLGFDWQTIFDHVDPDALSVYAGSAFGQVDENSFAALLRQPLLGGRVGSKMFALGLPDMAASFINSYVVNGIGNTGTTVGACASFLYNLKHALSDMQLGKTKVALVGCVDVAITPEIMEGLKCMGALATDAGLQTLDGVNEIDYRKACRPFSTNCGFSVGDSAQFIVLMTPDLAMQLGATIYGAVADIFVNADANKKSISSPGVGNYVTFAKAVALANAILGEKELQHSFVQAHGTGTPQNRVTESHIINEVAKTFGLTDWPVTSIKALVGHSFSAAGGDQLVATLGAWQYGFIPGINTIDHIAEDVFNSNLNILMDHHAIARSEVHAAVINSKGFGGNNASGLILSPLKAQQILRQRYTQAQMHAYLDRNEKVRMRAEAVDQQTCQGNERVVYQFGEQVMSPEDVTLTRNELTLSTYKRKINLKVENPFVDVPVREETEVNL